MKFSQLSRFVLRVVKVEDQGAELVCRLSCLLGRSLKRSLIFAVELPRSVDSRLDESLSPVQALASRVFKLLEVFQILLFLDFTGGQTSGQASQ